MANVNGIRSGEFNFGIMQSDHQYKALNGAAPFEAEGAMSDIRAVFSLQSEVFTSLARRDAKIASFDDLKGKRVNVGNPGSGQRDTLEEIMAVKGWDRSAFALAAELKPAEQASALGDNNIDAMTYFVGHPNGAIQEATTTTDAVLKGLAARGIVPVFVPAQTHTEGIAAVRSGKVDAYATDRLILVGEVLGRPSDVALKLSDDYLSIEPYALMMRRDADLRLAVNRALAQTYRSGEIIEVFRQSFPAGARPSSLVEAAYVLNALSE